MIKILLNLFFCAIAVASFAQKETFDLYTFTAPQGWKKNVEENIVSYTITDKNTNGWCRINVIKSTISKGSIEADFESEWQVLIVKNYHPTGDREVNEVQEAKGWKIQAGKSKFIFENKEAMAMLTTASGYDRCLSVVAVTNNKAFLKDVETFIESIDLVKPIQTPTVGSTQQPIETSSQANMGNASYSGNFKFRTTNFDDGWTATEQADWVEVTKENIKVLLHYPAEGTVFHGDPEPQTVAAWNVLVAPRFSNLKDFKTSYINNYNRPLLGMGYATEIKSGKEVFVLLFKQNGGWMEFITPDKKSFIKQFKFDPEVVQWDSENAIINPLLGLANCNKFAVAASDLTGKWSSSSSSVQEYYNVYTGNNAGMNISTASRTFQFGAGNTYQWNIVWVRGFSGSEKVSQDKFLGKFSMINNWQVQFSNMNKSGKPETYDAYFTCIKGGRILWMNSVQSPGSGIYTGYGKSE